MPISSNMDDFFIMSRKVTTDSFIESAKMIHGNKYDYSKVNYVSAQTKICIICPEHGEFWQTPNSHLNGKGCPMCSRNKKMDTNEFIRRAKEINGDKYDYSKVEYKNAHTKVCIICSKHGEFWQTPNNHLYSKKQCPQCIVNVKKTTKDFIEEAKNIHKDKYDYSKVKYMNYHTKVCIICPEHGEFWQDPNHHLRGDGCPKCIGRYVTTEEFIEKAKKVHGDRYDYSKTEYLGSKYKVCIICPEHGEFWQLPGCHLIGQGCPKCTSSILENTMRLKLQRLGIEFEEQKTFDWLKYKSYMFLDFYLPEYNIAIECQGIQHFEPVDRFGGDEEFNNRKYYDACKKLQCKGHNVNLLYFNYNDDINEFEQKLKEYGIH